MKKLDYYNFYYIKMSEKTTYYQRHREKKK